eukprot:1713370-Pyramimonas_sp.AAC.1
MDWRGFSVCTLVLIRLVLLISGELTDFPRDAKTNVYEPFPTTKPAESAIRWLATIALSNGLAGNGDFDYVPLPEIGRVAYDDGHASISLYCCGVVSVACSCQAA